VPAPLVKLVIAYAQTRDQDLAVSVQSDRQHNKTAWLCGPHGQDALVGWQLPILPDLSIGSDAHTPCVVKAVDFDHLPGVTLVVRGRICLDDRLGQMWLLRLQPPPPSSPSSGVVPASSVAFSSPSSDTSTSAEVTAPSTIAAVIDADASHRKLTFVALASGAEWGKVWHDGHHLRIGQHWVWRTEHAEWSHARSSRVADNGGWGHLGWDHAAQYRGYRLRPRHDTIEWLNSSTGERGWFASPAKSAIGLLRSPPITHRHGLSIDAETGVMHLVSRCCECHGSADHPEAVVVWSTRLSVRDASRSDHSDLKSSAAAASAVWHPSAVSGAMGYPLRLGCDPTASAPLGDRYSHTSDTAYHLHGTLPDGRAWFSAGVRFIAQLWPDAASHWRHSAHGESLDRLLGFTEQPDRRSCIILA
jgi:hypothetical protein